MDINIHDKYYIRKVNGGYSPCIAGNNARGLRPFDGSVLPNCVGLIVGAYNQFAGADGCPFLGNRKRVYHICKDAELTDRADPESRRVYGMVRHG